MARVNGEMNALDPVGVAAHRRAGTESKFKESQYGTCRKCVVRFRDGKGPCRYPK